MNKSQCLVCGSSNINKVIYLYAQCKQCHSLYLLHMPPDSFLEKAVQDYGMSTSSEPQDPKLIQIFKKRLSDLSPYIKPNASILDVGCGSGTFVRIAKNAGYNIEAMDKAIVCVKQIEAIGIPGYTDLKKVPNNRYDAITLFDVIEHVPNPKQFLEIIHKKLKKNGTLMITTPNIEGLTTKVVPKVLTYTKETYSEHLVLFTVSSLILLMSSMFAPVKTSTDTLMNWCYSTNILYKKIVNKIIYIAVSPIKGYLFSKNFGDNIQIIARKK